MLSPSRSVRFSSVVVPDWTQIVAPASSSIVVASVSVEFTMIAWPS